MDGPRESGLRRVGSSSSISLIDDLDLSRLLDKPNLNIERQRSFDKRSFSELSIGVSPRFSATRAAENSSRGCLDNYEGMCSPGGRSMLGTPASLSRNSFGPHPMVAEAWDALRRSLVFFRGQPVGTIAAHEHSSEEVLNYDQDLDWFLSSDQGDRMLCSAVHGPSPMVLVHPRWGSLATSKDL